MAAESVGGVNPLFDAYMAYMSEAQRQGIKPLPLDQWKQQQIQRPMGNSIAPFIQATAGVRG